MNRATAHSFVYVLKVWFSAGWVAIVLVLLVYAVDRHDILDNLSHPDILLILGLMFLIESVIVCSLMLIIVRYFAVLKWNSALIKLIVSILWFGVALISAGIMSAVLMLLQIILTRLSVQMPNPFQPITVDVFSIVLTIWALASVLFACCYRIRPKVPANSILPEL